MKKWKKYLILFVLIYPIKIYALTGNTSITCEKNSLNPGESTNCTIKGTTQGDTVSAVSAVLSSTSNLSIETVTPSQAWSGNKDDENIDYYTSDNQSGTFNIATISVKASSTLSTGSDVTISLKSIKFFGSDFQENTIANSNTTIRIKSTINTLSNLALSAGTLTPEFNENTTSYTANIDASSINITATKKSDKSTISGDIGDKTLKYGNNEFAITVTSESGINKVYHLTVIRKDNRDSVKTLKKLIVNNKEINLSNDKLTYQYNVDNKIMRAIIEAELTSDKSTFVEKYGPRTVILNEGLNLIELKIKAENEEITTYKIEVTREKSKQQETIKENDKNSTPQASTNTTNNKEFTNPKTGNTSVLIVIVLLVISIGVCIVVYKKIE